MLQGFLEEASDVLQAIRNVADGDRSDIAGALRNAEALADAAGACGLSDFEASSRGLVAEISLAIQEPARSLTTLHEAIVGVESSLSAPFSFAEPEPAGRAEQPEPSSTADEFEVDDELREVFAQEADELLENIESNLRLLSEDSANREALWEVRRNAHTFKGAAGVVGLKIHSTIAHRIEDFLDHLSEKKLGANEAILDLLNSATECLKQLTHEPSLPSVNARVAQTFAAFENAQSLIDNPPPEPATSAAIEKPAAPEKPAGDTKAAYAQTRSGLRVTSAILDDLVNNIHELMEIRTLFEQRLSKFDHYVSDVRTAASRMHQSGLKVENEIDIRTSSGLGNMAFADRLPAAAASLPGFDPLELDNYTELHEWARESTQAAGEALFYTGELGIVKNEIDSLATRLRFLIDQVQAKVSRVRNVEFGSVAARLQRAAKAACEEFPGKDVDVIVENGSILIDAQLAEKLIEPLSHLVRNSVVHGIESPDRRLISNKPVAGSITVRITNEETHVSIRLADDGSGVNFESLRSKALAQGLISPPDLAATADHELLFLEGLTTAPALSMNAGRGVGMSIVRKSIEALGGTLAVNSASGVGTAFTLRIPLTMVVLQSIVVRVGDHLLAVPKRNVQRIVELGSSVAETGTITLENIKYPVQLLANLLGMTPSTAADYVPVLLINTADSTHAIAVDEVLRTEEIIVKRFGRPLSAMTQYLGAAFLNSGHLVPIIDTTNLPEPAPPATTVEPHDAPAVDVTIMIVDDSPSVRVMTSRTITQAGYKPLAAKDGVDALNILGSLQQLPDMILTDIEMPQMDGYELLAALKSDERYKAIPVAMISSRSGDKHREKGLELGAVCYLTKPYNDAELINAMNESITSSAAG
ncbi:MAG: response regulator [Blastocatellia bacterium]|nr:response regulator [Blastocatellia bacterium]